MDSFFGIGIAELFFIAIIALIVLGPERLPGAMRELVKYLRYFRNLSSELTSQFSEEMKMLDDLNPQKIMQELIDDPKEEKATTKAVTPAKKSTPKSSTTRSSSTTSTTTSASTAVKKPSTPKATTPKKSTDSDSSGSDKETDKSSENASEAISDKTASKTTEKSTDKIAEAAPEQRDSEPTEDGVRDVVDSVAEAMDSAEVGASANVDAAAHDSPRQDMTAPTAHDGGQATEDRGQADKESATSEPKSSVSDAPKTVASASAKESTAVPSATVENAADTADADDVEDEVEPTILPPERKRAPESNNAAPESSAPGKMTGQGDGDNSSPMVERSATVSGSISVNGKRADAEE